DAGGDGLHGRRLYRLGDRLRVTQVITRAASPTQEISALAQSSNSLAQYRKYRQSQSLSGTPCCAKIPALIHRGLTAQQIASMIGCTLDCGELLKRRRRIRDIHRINSLTLWAKQVQICSQDQWLTWTMSPSPIYSRQSADAPVGRRAISQRAHLRRVSQSRLNASRHFCEQSWPR